jgi:hypothetical protein
MELEVCRVAADPVRDEASRLNTPENAVKEFLNDRFPHEGQRGFRDGENWIHELDRDEIGCGLLGVLEQIAGAAGTCVKTNTEDGTPIVVAAVDSSLWLVRHLDGEGDGDLRLGKIEASQLGGLRDGTLTRTVQVAWNRTLLPDVVELRHERLPGGRLLFDSSLLGRVGTIELEEALEPVIAGRKSG